MDYWDFVRPTYIESWPKELCQLSIAQADVPLTLEEAEALGTNLMELYVMFPKPHERDISGIVRRLDEAVVKFPKGAFVRLGSRSPKDAFIMDRKDGFRVKTGQEAIEILCATSERIMEDLLLALDHQYPPHIFVRQWVDLPKWTEFRCFMKARKLVGISQYQYFDGLLPQIPENKESIRMVIEEVFFPRFRQAVHLDDAVFDVFVKVRKSGNHRDWEAKLLEINPFFEMTDPCLFCWTNGGDFDGSFRHCEKPKRRVDYSKYLQEIRKTEEPE